VPTVPRNRRANLKPVALTLPAGSLTPVGAFLRMRRPGASVFLLESTEQGQRGGRFSYLGVDPIEVLSVKGGRLEIQSGGETTQGPGNPLTALAARLGEYRAERIPGLPPFQGGAVGYVSFGCARYVEPVLERSLAAAPGGAPDAVLMLFRSIVCFDHHAAQVHVIVNALLEQQSDSERTAHAAAQALREQLERPCPEEEAPLRAFAPPNSAVPALGPERFYAAVREIKEHIRRGDIFQCVMSDRFAWPLREDPFPIYRALCREHPTSYQFYVQDSDQVLLGASPELLVEVAGQHVETHPIAGTRPRGKSPQEDSRNQRALLRSVKERAEHLMLVDLGRNDLGRVCAPGSVSVREFMKVQRFAQVMHLVSVVEGQLEPGRTAWDALWACFPAGTLSGAPKLRAIEILSRLEGEGRLAYGGAVVRAGFDGDLAAAITIRSLLVRGGIGYAQAGAGIVADSSPEREYQEVLHKVAGVRRAIEGTAPSAAPRRAAGAR